MTFIRILLVSLLSSSLILLPVAQAAELALPSGDLVAPVIQHTPISEELPPGQAAEVTAKVTDNVGVEEVILYYRDIDNADFKRMKMKRDLDSDSYTAKLPVVTSPGLEYYIQATDLAGNTLLFGHSFSPLTITVAPAAVADEAAAVAAVEVDTKPSEKEEKSGMSKWIWIGLGAVAVGALAASGGGGDDAGGGDPIQPASTTGTVTITGPVP